MWKPKYLDHQLLAQQISDCYEKQKKDSGHIIALEKCTEEFGLSLTSIYRYLKYMGVAMPERKHDKKGRFTT